MHSQSAAGQGAGIVATRIPAASDSDTATKQTVQLMGEYIRKCSTDPAVKAAAEYAVNRFAAGKTEPWWKCWGVFWYAKHCVKFKLDEGTLFQLGEANQQDLLTAPDVLLRMKNPGEDCDGFTMLIASMLSALHVPVVICTVAASQSEPDRWSHVFACALLPGDKVVPLDASHGKYPGWMVPQENIYRWQAWDLKGQPVNVRPLNHKGLHGYVHTRTPMIPHYRRFRRRGMGVLCVDGADDQITNCAYDGGVDPNTPTPTPSSSPTLPFPYSVPGATPAPTPSGPSFMDTLGAQLALGAENIFGKVVAPQYSQVCDSSGKCSTVVTGPGTTAAGSMNVSGLGSPLVWVGLGLAGLFLFSQMTKGR